MRIVTNTPDELILRETPWNNIVYGTATFLCCTIAFVFLRSQSFALIFLVFAIVGIAWCLGLSRSALFHFDGKTGRVRIRIRSLLWKRDQSHPLALFKGVYLENEMFGTASLKVGRQELKTRAILLFRELENEPVNLLMGPPDKWAEIAHEINQWHQARGGEVVTVQMHPTEALGVA